MSRCFINIFLRKSPEFSLTFSRAFGSTKCVFGTYYETLKVNSNATTKEIKEAYFSLSKQNHPDLNPNDPSCHDRFIQLQEAYKVLSNPDSRKSYDMKINRRGPTYYSNPQRPYNPDFSARDEWIKRQNERMNKETEYGSHFGRRYDDPSNFNRYYSRPQNLTPEEMKQFLRKKELYTTLNTPSVIVLMFLVVMALLLIESSVTRHFREKTYEEKMLRNAQILARYRDPFYPRPDYQQQMRELEEMRRPTE